MKLMTRYDSGDNGNYSRSYELPGWAGMVIVLVAIVVLLGLATIIATELQRLLELLTELYS